MQQTAFICCTFGGKGDVDEPYLDSFSQNSPPKKRVILEKRYPIGLIGTHSTGSFISRIWPKMCINLSNRKRTRETTALNNSDKEPIPSEESDASWYRELVGERGVAKPTLDAAHKKVISFRDRALEIGISLLTIRRKDEGDFIGYCGLIIGRNT